jgi:hypothetical protein
MGLGGKCFGSVWKAACGLLFSFIAIALSPEAMEKFASFVMHAASEMKRMGTGYDRIHFTDFCKDWDPAWPDIQSTRMYDDA